MNLHEAITARHSVRRYTDQKIEGDVLTELQQTVDECNEKSGLHIQLCLNEPTAFTRGKSGYGSFNNVRNYIALVGKKTADFDEKCGYYGEKVVLKAQQLGLNTCWVAMTFSKSKSKKHMSFGPDEKLLMVISLGYGENSGNSRKTKSVEELSKADGAMPDWFLRGMEAVQLAPTAMNQQKFTFTLSGDAVSAVPGVGFYTKVDLGIAKYHFEIEAGDAAWHWA